MVDVALHVELHFQGAVPFLEREHRLPVDPEVRVVEVVVEHVVDRLVGKVFLSGEEQAQQLLRGARVHAVFLVGVGVLPLLFRHAAQREVGVGLVEAVILREDGLPGVDDGGDGPEQVPHAFEVVVHLSSAAHDVAARGVIDAVA